MQRTSGAQTKVIVITWNGDSNDASAQVPGVPIISVARGKYVVERLPDVIEK